MPARHRHVGYARVSDLKSHVVPPDMLLRDLLRLFNVISHHFVIAVDVAGRPVGTVTDGDIRRGILSGMTLEDPVSRCMVRNATIGRVGDEERLVDRLESLVFVPLVDRDGLLVDIMVKPEIETGIATALLMAGGMGTRLGELTRSVPKPLLHVGGKPIIEHIMLALEQAGIAKIIVSVHHLAEKIESFVESRVNRSRVEILRETKRLGTAGALGLIGGDLDGPILVLNADLVTSVNIPAMATFFTRHKHDATIGVAQHKVRIPFGVVRQDDHGLFDGVDEKPEISHFVTAGIYLLSPEFASLVPPNDPIDMPDLLNRGRAAGLKIGLFPIHEYWTDVGTPDALDAADNHMNEIKGK